MWTPTNQCLQFISSCSAASCLAFLGNPGIRVALRPAMVPRCRARGARPDVRDWSRSVRSDAESRASLGSRAGRRGARMTPRRRRGSRGRLAWDSRTEGRTRRARSLSTRGGLRSLPEDARAQPRRTWVASLVNAPMGARRRSSAPRWSARSKTFRTRRETPRRRSGASRIGPPRAVRS